MYLSPFLTSSSSPCSSTLVRLGAHGQVASPRLDSSRSSLPLEYPEAEARLLPNQPTTYRLGMMMRWPYALATSANAKPPPSKTTRCVPSGKMRVLRYTATEDVNYATHSARSSHRSESVTSRTSARGRSTSSEISTGSETRSLPVYIAIQDYTPEPSDLEAVALEQGQIVEVLDNKNAASWLVRTKARPPVSGWVPGSYFETPTEYYKQRRRTRELTSPNLKMTDEQEAILKRDQAYHDLLRSEEDFVTDLSSTVDNYVRALDDPAAPQAIKDHKAELVLNLRELYNFHANVMLKGLQYYSDDPGKVGQTFVRLERDFDHHVHYYRESPKVLQLIENNSEIKDYLQASTIFEGCGASCRVS
uniref:SH3 domain-containing protein n=1 Tax=Panagrellus redivivus TaxID=6233 RepID=A0A7E4US35_PANRE